MTNEVLGYDSSDLNGKACKEIENVLAGTGTVEGDRLFPSPASPDNPSISSEMKLAQRLYNRLTTALEAAGITERRLAEIPNPGPFSFVYPEGEFDINITVDTLRMARTVSQRTGGFYIENFEIAADGSASYKRTNFSNTGQQQDKTVNAHISQDNQEEPQIVIENLGGLTNLIEECTDNPEYSSPRIKQHLAAFYDNLVDHLSSVGITREQAPVKSNNRQIYIPGLGIVVPSFVEKGDTPGILLKQFREGIPVKQWYLWEGGNASVISQRRTAEGDQVLRQGRIQINEEGDFSFNHYLVYIELHQVMTTRIRSHAS